MNKFGVVLGIAAVATLAGCKDPDFKRSGGMAPRNEAKNIDTAPANFPARVAPAPVAIEPVVKKCTCPPGTKHTSPCTCGAPDCRCIVETKPVIVADVSKAPSEPEYTIYVVQNGDYLAKISKRFNVTIASIKRFNPSIKNDVILVGQKLKIPGKVDVPVAAPVVVTPTATATAAKKTAAKKGFVPYTGATKEYVVKSGDTLGSIAYGNGINIRQLKELNGISSDSLKIGQKLKIPAEKVVKAPAKAGTGAVAAKETGVRKPAVVETKKADASAVADAAAATAAPVERVAEAAVVEAVPANVVEAAPAKAETAATTTYVVQEGDDMTGVSIRWGVSAAEIRELNNLADGDQLVPGQIIKLPADAQQ